MPITERTLRKWRIEALKLHSAIDIECEDPIPPIDFIDRKYLLGVQSRILRMTQELLDQHLLRKK